MSIFSLGARRTQELLIPWSACLVGGVLLSWMAAGLRADGQLVAEQLDHHDARLTSSAPSLEPPAPEMDTPASADTDSSVVVEQENALPLEAERPQAEANAPQDNAAQHIPTIDSPHSGQVEAVPPASPASAGLPLELRVPLDPPKRVHVIIPPGRPDWVEAGEGNDGQSHWISVSSRTQLDLRDADLALDKAVSEATRKHINAYLKSDIAASLLSRYDLQYIHDHLLPEQNVYQEQIEVSVGPVFQKHAKLVFTPAFHNQLEADWHDVIAKSRLLGMTLIGGLLLGLLSVTFGYLKLDTATRGYYTGRLQFAATVAILTLIGSGVVLAKWIHWM